MLVVNQDHSIPHHWFISRALQADLRGFKISRSQFESFGAQFLKFICVQFLDQASVVDDSDARRQSVHFSQDMARHKYGNSLFVCKRL